VLLYGLAADGSKPRVRLILFDVAGETAPVIEQALEGVGYGLVGWNRGLVATASLFALALLGWVAYSIIRGTGTISVRIKRDPAVERDTFCLRATRRRRGPVISAAERFAQRAQRIGHRVRARAIVLAGPSEQLRLPAGHWWVHLYGTYRKAGEVRVLGGEKTSRPVHVRRGEVEVLTFDLVPHRTEIYIQVQDGRGPAARVELVIEALELRVATGDDGKARLELPPGNHELRVRSRGFELTKQVSVIDTRVLDLHINLERERRLADLAGGIELDGLVPAEGAAEGAAGAADEDPQRHQPLAVGSSPQAPSDDLAAGAPMLGAAGPPSISAPPEGLVSAVPHQVPGMSHAAALAAGAPDAVASAATAAFASDPARSPAIVPRRDVGAGLARYRVKQELGRGAMGVVYRACDTVLERDVALKLMTEEMRQYPAALQMFMQEAKALAQLNHGNIVTVYDQGDHDGQAFMVMELVEGRTLEHELEKASRPLPVRSALAITDQLCAGLAYAHQRKVIHRDIKPANIFVSAERIVKIGDFGLARVIHEIRIQRTEIRGTPLYMAPEQIRGTNIDFRADLYAVGCTLYEMVTGRPPFVDGEILYHHLHTPPEPPSTHADIPRALDELVLACIEKDAERRIGSAAEIRARLRQVALDRPQR